MEHLTVSGVTAGKVPTLDPTCKATALTDAGNVDEFTGCKVFDQHTVANFCFILRFLDANFLQNLHGCYVGFFEMSGHGFVDALRLDEFDEAKLRGVVAVFCFGAALHYNAGTRLQNGATDQVAVRGEDLGHAQLDSDNAFDCHFTFLSLAACSVALAALNK